MDEILTVSDVASRLKMAERTIYAMLSSGEMPGFKIRGQWRLKKSEFEGWLNSLSNRNARVEAPVSSTAGDIQPEEDVLLKVASTPMGGVAEMTPRLGVAGIHQRFMDGLGDAVTGHSELGQKPLELDLKAPLPGRVRLYLFNATRPAGGRPLGEHKIQLILPGQQRGQRGTLDHGDGRFAVLAGYSVEDDVFILWDAGLYDNFAWSRNVQVKAETITTASAGMLAEQTRVLRPRGAPQSTETVVACTSQMLAEGLARRVELTLARLAS